MPMSYVGKGNIDEEQKLKEAMGILRENGASISSEERQSADEEEELERDSRALKKNAISMSCEERQEEEDDKKLGRDAGISEE